MVPLNLPRWRSATVMAWRRGTCLMTSSLVAWRLTLGRIKPASKQTPKWGLVCGAFSEVEDCRGDGKDEVHLPDDLKPRCLETDTRAQKACEQTNIKMGSCSWGLFCNASEDLDLELARLKSFGSSGSSAVCVEHDGATQPEIACSVSKASINNGSLTVLVCWSYIVRSSDFRITTIICFPPPSSSSASSPSPSPSSSSASSSSSFSLSPFIVGLLHHCRAPGVKYF